MTISGCGALGSTIGEEEQGLICARPQLPKSGLSSGPLATSKPASGNTGPSSPASQTVASVEVSGARAPSAGPVLLLRRAHVVALGTQGCGCMRLPNQFTSPWRPLHTHGLSCFSPSNQPASSYKLCSQKKAERQPHSLGYPTRAWTCRQCGNPHWGQDLGAVAGRAALTSQPKGRDPGSQGGKAPAALSNPRSAPLGRQEASEGAWEVVGAGSHTRLLGCNVMWPACPMVSV